MFANDAATQLLDESDTLSAANGNFSAMSSGARDALEQFMATCLATGKAVAALPRTGQPLRLFGALLETDAGNAYPLSESAAPLIVIALGLARDGIMDEQVVADQFGLTPCEARLACDLSLGKEIKRHAADRGISVHTARFQLKQLMAKLGAHRQGDVVRMVHLAPSLAIRRTS